MSLKLLIASNRAVASPIPEVAPVMRAIRLCDMDEFAKDVSKVMASSYRL